MRLLVLRTLTPVSTSPVTDISKVGRRVSIFLPILHLGTEGRGEW